MMTSKRRPRGNLAERGYDKDYFRARNAFMRDHPWCQMCAKSGKWVKSQHCDHVETIKARPDLRLDKGNFMALCGKHHDMMTRAFDSGDLRGAVDENGYPLDPRHPWAQPTPEQALATVNQPFTKQTPPPGLTAALKRRAVRGR